MTRVQTASQALQSSTCLSNATAAVIKDEKKNISDKLADKQKLNKKNLNLMNFKLT